MLLTGYNMQPTAICTPLYCFALTSVLCKQKQHQHWLSTTLQVCMNQPEWTQLISLLHKPILHETEFAFHFCITAFNQTKLPLCSERRPGLLVAQESSPAMRECDRLLFLVQKPHGRTLAAGISEMRLYLHLRFLCFV